MHLDWEHQRSTCGGMGVVVLTLLVGIPMQWTICATAFAFIWTSFTEHDFMYCYLYGMYQVVLLCVWDVSSNIVSVTII